MRDVKTILDIINIKLFKTLFSNYGSTHMFMDCIDIIFYFSPPNLNYLPTPMFPFLNKCKLYINSQSVYQLLYPTDKAFLLCIVYRQVYL